MDSPAEELRNAPKGEFKIETFTADSALIAELGERLVGQAHIALAELVKNSYDADASKCQITIGRDFIAVEDDGHGMDRKAFVGGWMRVGTQRKRGNSGLSPAGRQLTGSKGIGRLSAQFLGRRLYMWTRAAERGGKMIQCRIDWDQVVRSGELIKSTAEYRAIAARGEQFLGSPTGTRIVIEHLNEDWADRERLRNLARELWVLRPPKPLREKGSRINQFEIELKTHEPNLDVAFEKQMTAALENWEARIVGRVSSGRRKPVLKLKITLAMDTGRDSVYETNIEFPGQGHVENLNYDIRVFRHMGKQKRGVLVGDMRDYFSKFGGIHVTDGSFRLPYYGISHDWLGIEVIHSHRRSLPTLLPKELRIQGALEDMPTQSRLFGVVRVNTGEEERIAEEHRDGEFLKIQVTRDRLAENKAYRQMRDMTLAGLEYFAVCKRQQSLRRITEELDEKTHGSPDRVAKILEKHRAEIPKSAYKEVSSELRSYTQYLEKQQKQIILEKATMATLATAGMAAVTLEHELQRHLSRLRTLSKELRKVLGQSSDATELLSKLEEWMNDANASRKLLLSIMDPEGRTEQKRYRVREVVREAIDVSQPFLRNIEPEYDGLETTLRLPLGTHAEWQALFQNVLINAVNALLDTPKPRIVLKSVIRSNRGKNSVIVQDNGVGIDLSEAHSLFEPFKRRVRISKERSDLGVGGTGLGLTIVRTIAEGRGAKVGFKTPEKEFSTAFELSWEADDVE